MAHSSRVRSFAAVAVAVAVGCSGARTPYPVSGQVSFDDGKPATELAGWVVTFDSPELKASSVGTVGPDGRYALDYLKAGDGALPGAYKVTVSLPGAGGGADDDGRGAKRRKAPIAAKYSDTRQTPLTATVEAKTNDIPLTVSRPQ